MVQAAGQQIAHPQVPCRSQVQESVRCFPRRAPEHVLPGLAVAAHHARDTSELFGAGADIVLEPFHDAAYWAVDLPGGAPEEDRTEIPLIVTEEKQVY
jgi:hypothetical protein